MERRIGLTLDPQRAEPLHRQIFDQIVTRIQSGAFPGGHRLPPTRALASEVGAHRNTVVRAYEELVEAGFVTSTVGRGTFVSVSPPPMPLPSVPSGDQLPWGSLLSRIAAERPLQGTDRLEIAPGGESLDVVNLARIEPSADLIPHELFRRCVDYVLRTMGPRVLGPAPRQGAHRLRSVVAEDLGRLGVPAGADTILITGGHRQALDLVARGLINPGDPFLVDALTDRVAASIFAAAGARLIPVPDDGEGPSLAFLKRHTRAGAKGFYVIPNGHDPTGITLSLERRTALSAWSREAGVPLIEGDHSAELRLDGQGMIPPLRALDGDVIYVGGLAERLIPSVQVGVVIAPTPIRPALAALQQTAFGGAPALLQHALAEFLERGYLRAHLSRLVPAIRARREALLDGLMTHLPRGTRVRRPEHGAHLWVPLPAWLSPERLEAQARRCGVLVTPSVAFAVGGHERAGLRLTFAAEPPERLAEGARRLGKAMGLLLGNAAPQATAAQPRLSLPVRETA